VVQLIRAAQGQSAAPLAVMQQELPNMSDQHALQAYRQAWLELVETHLASQ